MLTNLLQGRRIKLNALSKDDTPVMACWEEDTAFLRLLNATVAVPRTDAAIFDWVDGANKSQTEVLFGIRQIESGELIGVLGFDGILWSSQVAGFYIGFGRRDDWGKGYGTEAMELALNFAFNELNLHRVQLTVYSYNSRAIALYQKWGFQQEGVFREFLYRDGQRHDMILYSLLRHEWEAQQSPGG